MTSEGLSGLAIHPQETRDKVGIGVRSKIHPGDINTKDPFAPIFGFDRANVAANTLVKLAQQNGSWRNFAIDEVDLFVETAFVFNGLTSGRRPLIIRRKDGRYAFTDEFIEKCAASALKRRSPAVPPASFRAGKSETEARPVHASVRST